MDEVLTQIKKLQRIAIVNRGEAAIRFINAAREYDENIKIIALYTTPDQKALFVREADISYNLGSPFFIDPKDNNKKSSYLDYIKLEKALIETKADAVWPGWGFVSEQHEFVELCEKLQITFLGPTSSVMKKLGDKISSKFLAEESDVPITNWSRGEVKTLEEAINWATKLGYPLMLKASSGGGGRGIRKIEKEEDLKNNFVSAKNEALKAFGDDRLFLEKMVQKARHIEVQVIADNYGNAYALGVRDCTIQRRNQKVIEEGPSPVLSTNEDLFVKEAARRLVEKANYRSVGTVEFLYDLDHKNFYFMEVNTRLQVEHSVTELVTSFDLVKMQIDVASGKSLSYLQNLIQIQSNSQNNAHACVHACVHAIEVRLNAEDPENNFAPGTGKIIHFSIPNGPGIRVDSGVQTNDTISPDFDSMIAKIISYGENRQTAVRRLIRTLQMSSIILEHGDCNRSFLINLLKNSDYLNTNTDIGWLDRKLKDKSILPQKNEKDILLSYSLAAISAYENNLKLQLTNFFIGARRGRPTLHNIEKPFSINLEYNSMVKSIIVQKINETTYLIHADKVISKINITRFDDHHMALEVNNSKTNASIFQQGTNYVITIGAQNYRISMDNGGEIKSEAPGIVINIPVKKGDHIKKGDAIIILEAMKMETIISSPKDGIIGEIFIQRNQQVSPGTLLLKIQNDEASANNSSLSKTNETACYNLNWNSLEYNYNSDNNHYWRELRSLMLGLDSNIKWIDDNSNHIETKWHAGRALEIIDIFSSIEKLFKQNESSTNKLNSNCIDNISKEEYFDTYLKLLNIKSDKIEKTTKNGKHGKHEEEFRTNLLKTLQFYGINDLDNNAQIEEALYRIYRSHQLLEQKSKYIFKLLQQTNWNRSFRFKKALERIIDVTNTNLLAINDSARIIHYNYFIKTSLCSQIETSINNKLEQTNTFISFKNSELERMKNFNIEELNITSDPSVKLYCINAKENNKDKRIVALAEITDFDAQCCDDGYYSLPQMERVCIEAFMGIRHYQSQLPKRSRLHWNRIVINVLPPMNFKLQEVLAPVVRRLSTYAVNLGLEKVVVKLNMPRGKKQEPTPMTMNISYRTGIGLRINFEKQSNRDVKTLSQYEQKIIAMRMHDMIYPYEIVRMMTPTKGALIENGLYPGDFTEYDLVEEKGNDYNIKAVQRQYGLNKCNVIVGTITNYTNEHVEGLKRVIILGDASREMGALAEKECRLLIAAINMAEEYNIPIEWFAASSGAKIAFDSGTENLDWVALVLKRIIQFTQNGGEINVIVDSINVGAQSYWNAEATMLMHSKGILIMTPNGSMVLTGKRALDYSGGISATTNQGIGGIERIMGPNGEATYYAHDLKEACKLLLNHYKFTYKKYGEKFPRKIKTQDLATRDIQSNTTIAEIFSEKLNSGKKKPFEIRTVLQEFIDNDTIYLEKYSLMRDAETSVIWDTSVGGIPITLIGIESQQQSRFGLIPGDGPEQWSGGTLFPLSSKKIAKSINSASNNRPVVILANLSGFDGSPESMRNLQLEYGAEIGRAIVNFKGPIIFLVISRYHGGAYVVFSRALNDSIIVSAVKGTFASVIGGAPAAAVVFPNEVNARVYQDERIIKLQNEINTIEHDKNWDVSTTAKQKNLLQENLKVLFKEVFNEKQREVAEEFDRIHSVERAKKVGSIHHIIEPTNIRSFVIDTLEKRIG